MIDMNEGNFIQIGTLNIHVLSTPEIWFCT